MLLLLAHSPCSNHVAASIGGVATFADIAFATNITFGEKQEGGHVDV
jgi:hypothetical protein